MSSSESRFGLWTLSFLVVANMVGAGVFTTSGFTLAALGTPERVIAAWAVGGVIAICGAIAYGQLVRAMPESGGEYLFLSRAAHPLLGFVGGWVSLIAGFTGAIAFAATAFESYLVLPSWLPTDSVAIALVIAAGLLHGFGPRCGALLQNVAVMLKLGLLTVFVGLALRTDFQGTPMESAGPFNLSAFAQQLVWISLSYSGFNAAVYVAGESVRRQIPKALLIGTAATTALYLALNTVFVYGPPAASVAGQADVAAIAAESVGGAGLAIFVRIIIAVALATSVSSLLMAGPRVATKMAEDGFLPRALKLKSGRPGYAVGALVIASVVIILVSELESLLGYLGVTLSVCAAMTVGCLFLPKLRGRPSSMIAPALFVAATLTSATLLICREPEQGWAVLATFAVGAAAYWLTRTRR